MAYMAKKLCLVVGAGAIGKSVAGYAFSDSGYECVFLDVVGEVIDDLNARGGYDIYTMMDGAVHSREAVRGISARMLGDGGELFLKADVLSTSVGPIGLKAFIPLLVKWTERREGEGINRPLAVLLLENDANCAQTVRQGIADGLGYIPQWMTVAKASVERMTMRLEHDGVIDVMAEPYVRAVIGEEVSAKFGLDNRYFQPVKNPSDYYERKLFMNNAGHAVLGFYGAAKGYERSLQALSDGEIATQLRGVLGEAARVLAAGFGFSMSELEEHADSLIKVRYRAMDDDLSRLSRDPERKIARGERVLGIVENGLRYGIGTPYTARLFAQMVASDGRLSQAAKEGRLLKDICGIGEGEELYKYLSSQI